MDKHEEEVYREQEVLEEEQARKQEEEEVIYTEEVESYWEVLACGVVGECWEPEECMHERNCSEEKYWMEGGPQYEREEATDLTHCEEGARLARVHAYAGPLTEEEDWHVFELSMFRMRDEVEDEERVSDLMGKKANEQQRKQATDEQRRKRRMQKKAQKQATDEQRRKRRMQRKAQKQATDEHWRKQEKARVQAMWPPGMIRYKSYTLAELRCDSNLALLEANNLNSIAIWLEDSVRTARTDRLTTVEMAFNAAMGL
jgi:hypothetical protein